MNRGPLAILLLLTFCFASGTYDHLSTLNTCPTHNIHCSETEASTPIRCSDMEDEDSFVVPAAPSSEPNDESVNSCTICSRLLDAAHRIIDMSIQKRDHGWEFDEDSDSDVEVTVSEIESISKVLAASTCERHQDFMRSTFDIQDEEDLSRRQVEALWNAEKDRAVLADVRRTWSENQRVEETRRNEIILLDSEPHLPQLPCTGRPRDEDFISVDLIRQWIFSCEMDHKKSCCIPIQPSIRLSWVIDTAYLCLVPAEHDTQYIALSYVWGQTEMLKTTRKTLHSLQTVGALSTTSPLRVPRVIQHAILLASQLRQRYLWVDSLCIMQDDKESLDRHIRYMASIFKAAFFTIVAADGLDAEYGILGIKGISEPRTLPPVLQLSKRLRIRSRGWLNEFSSPWGHRGWTLQEHIFSKRKLIFVHGSVRWICQESRYFEDICQESISNRQERVETRKPASVGELALKYPMISQIEEILIEYTRRNLTFGNDSIRAIESIFTACGEAYPSGFILGLPLDFFDMALLWRHIQFDQFNDKFRLKRRAVATPGTQSPFPSWTWAGWIGELSVGAWRAATYIKDANEHDRFGERCSTIPMLEWRCRSEKDGSEWPIRGQNQAYAYKLKFMGKEDGLPLGWKYERDPPQPIQEDTTTEDTASEDKAIEDYLAEEDRLDNDLYKDQEFVMPTPYYYSHDSAPGVKFWHPVPIFIGMEETVTNPINCRLLCASTRTGRLWVTTNRSGGFFEVVSKYPIADGLLMDIRGEVVGKLWISDIDDCQLVNTYERQPDEAGYPCELVAISKANIFTCPMEPGKETFTFYNVLWVNWKDGIAYRRGVGRVKRDVWESMELEDVDLVLG